MLSSPVFNENIKVKRYLENCTSFNACMVKMTDTAVALSVLLDTPKYMSLIVRKPVFGISDQVRHKPGCTATEDG